MTATTSLTAINEKNRFDAHDIGNFDLNFRISEWAGMHYAQERERPNMQSIRDGKEGKGDEQLPN